jgi:sigma-E factor negative regulatory protein RseB
MQVVAKRAVLIVALAAGFFASAQAAEESANEARAWLARMSEALANRNYDARFLHLVGSHAENMRIIHRVAEGAVTERLVSLDGSGREVVRTQSEVVCYLPDRRTVLVEKRTDNKSLLGTVPVYSEGLQTYYDLATPGTTRILGRAAQYLTVQPRDNFRYGYRLWLDQETALPLKSQLCDRAGRVIEQIVFSELNVPASIDAALLKSSISTVGFQWIRQELHAQRVPNRGSAPATGWVVVNPPQGFRLTVTRVRNFGSAAPVQHLVLSDGLASVSVFIEPNSDARPANGSTSAAAQSSAGELSRVGSALAYSTETQEHRVTAVGEVPANTLRAIATSVQRESIDVNAQPSATNNNTASEDHTR